MIGLGLVRSPAATIQSTTATSTVVGTLSRSVRHDRALPWLGNRPEYEDWCLLDGSWALDPLNAFAGAGPVMSAHDAAAAQMEEGHGGLYALVWGRTHFA
jgi:hypothetical protein